MGLDLEIELKLPGYEWIQAALISSFLVSGRWMPQRRGEPSFFPSIRSFKEDLPVAEVLVDLQVLVFIAVTIWFGAAYVFAQPAERLNDLFSPATPLVGAVAIYAAFGIVRKFVVGSQ